jgi:hypothetical protein
MTTQSIECRFEGRTCCHLPKTGINRETVKFV